MLRLHSLSLLQFKNYHQHHFRFTERVTGICGKNGVGKTNLLDAIHYLCFTRSYFSRADSYNVQAGKTGFRLEGEFERSGQSEKAVCILRETGKKEFSVNEEGYEKFSRHIGRYPCVVIAPDDAELITGGSEERRKFMDALLSQLDATYLQQLILYNKVLQQRNALLRQFAETQTKNEELLGVLNSQLVPPGEYIFNRRKDFLLSFLAMAKRLYQDIARQPEEVSLVYESELLQATMNELLRVNREKDGFALRTTSGIHRDDLDIRLDGQVFRNIASQGQRKSLLFALKLAELEALKAEKGFAPLLLLDDVFEKLDEDRISNLLHKVCVENDGQVFITDTNEERLYDHLAVLGLPFSILKL